MNEVLKSDMDIFIRNFIFINEIRHSKCIVTGATGLIGSTIIRCLLMLNEKCEADISIIGLVRNVAKAENIFQHSEVKWLDYDLTQPFDLQEENVDYIFHCACPTSSKYYIENPVELIKTSVQGSLSLLDYAVKHSVRGMVYLSSCEVYGSVLDDSQELTEEYSGYVNPLDVRSGYPMAKRMVECLCHSYSKEYKIPVMIARLTQTFGAGVSLADNRVFAQFCKSVINNEDIVLHTKGESAKPYCYTIDAVNALFYLLFCGDSGQAYNVANTSTYISIKDLANFVINEFSTTSKIVIDEKEGMGYAPVTRLKMSTQKLEHLGWRPIYSLSEMFENIITYYKSVNL